MMNRLNFFLRPLKKFQRLKYLKKSAIETHSPRENGRVTSYVKPDVGRESPALTRLLIDRFGLVLDFHLLNDIYFVQTFVAKV
jgi:hypothetical protein